MKGEVVAVPTALKVDPELRRALMALTQCASRDATRPALMCVEFNDRRAVATDSYVLGVVELPDSLPEPVRVSALWLHDLLKSIKPENGVIFEIGFETADTFMMVESRVTHGTAQMRLPCIDIDFPNWKPLVDSPFYDTPDVNREPPYFDYRLLAKVVALAPKGTPIKLRWNDPLKPIVVERASGSFLGLVMPVRI